MPARERIKKQAPQKSETKTEEVQAKKAGEDLKSEIDDLLDEIDAVLEENAEEFVRNYVQKGGQ